MDSAVVARRGKGKAEEVVDQVKIIVAALADQNAALQHVGLEQCPAAAIQLRTERGVSDLREDNNIVRDACGQVAEGPHCVPEPPQGSRKVLHVLRGDKFRITKETHAHPRHDIEGCGRTVGHSQRVDHDD